MSLFSEIEKTIERGFRRWTDKMFGEAESDQLLLVHRAILEEIEGKVQTIGRGRRVFPFPTVKVTLISADAERRALYQAAFGSDDRLQKDILESLASVECELPRGFTVEVATAADGPGNFVVEYAAEPKAVEVRVVTAAQGRLTAVKGKTAQAEYLLEKSRTNLGRTEELMDADQRVVRRNDVVFEDGADVAAGTVSRKHAHIRHADGEYRICDDGSEFGTRIFREGRSIEVPAGNRRGEKLRPGDEIYLGRACLRFEQ